MQNKKTDLLASALLLIEQKLPLPLPTAMLAQYDLQLLPFHCFRGPRGTILLKFARLERR